MDNQLDGRRALVTGGGSGIGRAIALRLAQAGADVVVHYGTSADQAAETAKAIEALGRRALAVAADVLDPAATASLVDQAAQFTGGQLDVLVNNAGHLVGRCPIETMTDEHWHRVIDVNVTSTFQVCRAAIPLLRAGTDAAVVNIGSVAGHNGGGPGSVAYATAKAAVHGFTRGLAKELAPDRIRVNAVAPGFIGRTAFHDTFTPPEARQAIVGGVPLGREGTPDDVADAVVFLASAAASYLTGVTLDINGGMLFR